MDIRKHVNILICHEEGGCVVECHNESLLICQVGELIEDDSAHAPRVRRGGKGLYDR